MYLKKIITSDIFKISKDEIFDFAKNYDPMFFHMDESKAEDSIFTELVSSGLHTTSDRLQNCADLNTISLHGLVPNS